MKRRIEAKKAKNSRKTNNISSGNDALRRAVIPSEICEGRTFTVYSYMYSMCLLPV